MNPVICAVNSQHPSNHCDVSVHIDNHVVELESWNSALSRTVGFNDLITGAHLCIGIGVNVAVSLKALQSRIVTRHHCASEFIF